MTRKRCRRARVVSDTCCSRAPCRIRALCEQKCQTPGFRGCCRGGGFGSCPTLVAPGRPAVSGLYASKSVRHPASGGLPRWRVWVVSDTCCSRAPCRIRALCEQKCQTPGFGGAAAVAGAGRVRHLLLPGALPYPGALRAKVSDTRPFRHGGCGRPCQTVMPRASRMRLKRSSGTPASGWVGSRPQSRATRSCTPASRLSAAAGISRVSSTFMCSRWRTM